MKIFYVGEIRGCWEQSWLKLLMGRYFDDIQIVNPDADAEEDTVIISSPGRLNKIIDQLNRKNKRFGVFLLSDEVLADDNFYINHDNCQFVIRNYIHPASYQSSKCLNIGLGYKINFEKHTLGCSYFERDYVWNFIGSVHHDDRRSALNGFERVDGGFTHITSGFNASDYLSTEAYAQVLSRSVFTLCPMGHVNIDTFRVYESLEAGSIPVVMKHSPMLRAEPSYWNYMFLGEIDVPFLICDSWDEAANLVVQETNSGYARVRAKKCELFWAKWKSSWKYSVQSRLMDLACLDGDLCK